MNDEKGNLFTISGTSQRLRTLWESTIGKKIIVATTGAILALYVVGHMAGNLKAFQGAGSGGEAAPINLYAEFLRTVGKPVLPEEGALWLVRVVLLAALILHVVGITQLYRRNLAARPSGHAAARVKRSWASRSMQLSGLIVLAFIVFHILQFTTGTVEAGAAIVTGEVYANLARVFDHWYYAAIYVVCVGLIALHLKHGIWSMFQTLGWDNPDRNMLTRRTATVTAVLVFLGFAAVPISYWAGAMDEPSETAAEVR